jgi:hypothetical protein
LFAKTLSKQLPLTCWVRPFFQASASNIRSRQPTKRLILSSIAHSRKLGELLPTVSQQLPVSATVAIGAFLAVLLIVVLQSDQRSDDDDSGPGDGGLMQPVGAGA